MQDIQHTNLLYWIIFHIILARLAYFYLPPCRRTGMGDIEIPPVWYPACHFRFVCLATQNFSKTCMKYFACLHHSSRSCTKYFECKYVHPSNLISSLAIFQPIQAWVNSHDALQSHTCTWTIATQNFSHTKILGDKSHTIHGLQPHASTYMAI